MEKSKHYDMIFYARTEEQLGLDYVPVERIKRAHVGKRALIAKGSNVPETREELSKYKEKVSDDISLFLGIDPPSKYLIELKEIEEDLLGVIITKLSRLTKNKSLESRAA